MRYSGTLSSPSIDPRSIVNVLIFSIGLKINNAEDAMLVYGTFNKELVKYILKHINSSPVNLVYKNFESEEEAKNFSHSLLSRLSGVDIFGQAGETNVLGQRGMFYVYTIVPGTDNFYQVNGPISIAPWVVK